MHTYTDRVHTNMSIIHMWAGVVLELQLRDHIWEFEKARLTWQSLLIHS